MYDERDLTLDCQTCVATNTTACSDCVVTHLLANDDGPIDYVLAPVEQPVSATDRAIELFAKAGLLDDPVELVPHDRFVASEVAKHTPIA